MIYKTLKKVSNVCQFIEPNFLSSQSAGLTITNNGDTFIVNGTATKKSSIGAVIKNWTPIIGHKILVSGCPEGGGATTFRLGAFNQRDAYDSGNGAIGSVITTGKWFGIVFESGVTFNNLVFKPQLFDLTEMYGAGNEPTTVEQFRQDFPDEMYDYKPYCFVKSYKTLLKATDDKIITSYKKSLICTTKNLLPYPYYETTITRNGVTFTDNRDGTITANGTSTSFATFVFSKNYNFIAGNTYYVSIPYSIIAYKENGTIYYIQGNKSFTWSSNWEVVQIYMQINKGITLNNLKVYPMINLGSTATEYHPYGYL